MSKEPRPPSRIGRKRRTLGWTLLTLGVLVGGVWAASGWSDFGGDTSDGWWQIYKGEFTAVWFDPAAPMLAGGIQRLARTPIIHVGSPRWTWWNFRAKLEISEGGATFVLWPIPLLLWAPVALLLRSGIIARRRAMTNTCTKCGYSLAGLGDGAACPECGKAPMQKTVS